MHTVYANTHKSKNWKCYDFKLENVTYGVFELNLFLLKLKTENWKYCNKIIFKYVNSTVGPIFNIF